MRPKSNARIRSKTILIGRFIRLRIIKKIRKKIRNKRSQRINKNLIS